MSGAGHKFIRVTALLVILALCWPMATALAAGSSAPARPACCMRMSHACYQQQTSGNKLEAVCRTCGWCHELPNARADQTATKVSFHVSVSRAALHVESESRPLLAPSRLHASRAPPRSLSLALQES